MYHTHVTSIVNTANLSLYSRNLHNTDPFLKMSIHYHDMDQNNANVILLIFYDNVYIWFVNFK